MLESGQELGRAGKFGFAEAAGFRLTLRRNVEMGRGALVRFEADGGGVSGSFGRVYWNRQVCGW